MKWQRHENLFLRASPFFGTEICLKILPGNSTWNLNITPAKRKFTSETSTSIFGFKMLSLKGLYSMEIGENLLIRVPWDVPTGLSLWFDTSHQLPRTESAFPTLKLNEGPKEANHRTAWLGFGLATASVFFTSNNRFEPKLQLQDRKQISMLCLSSSHLILDFGWAICLAVS